MADVIDLNLSKKPEDSFENFSRGQKTRETKRVLADTVYDRLRDAILSAELRPNSRLVEDELADWLNISRTPIRESLLRLEQEGLVERNRGWFVREHNADEIRARMECRIAVEGYATRLAASRRTEEDLQEIIALENLMEKSTIMRTDFNQANYRFHKAITEAAKNPTLAILQNQTRLNYWDMSVPVIFDLEDERKVIEAHRGLIDALVARDGDRAEAVARAHMQMTMDVILGALQMRGKVFTT